MTNLEAVSEQYNRPGPAQRPAGRPSRERRAPRAGMMVFVLRRLALGLFTAFVISVLVFAATQALPGDAALAKLGNGATPEALAAFRERLHMNESLLQQYLLWASDLLRGDLGTSFTTDQPLATEIGPRIQNTLALLFVAAIIGVPTSIFVGIVAAQRRDGIFDHAVSTFLLVVAALPEFVIGIILVLIFATNVFSVLPAASLLDPEISIWSQTKYLVLPALTLALAIIPYVARITRASMIEVLESDYVAMARLKGLGERRVLLRYAFPNVSGPTFQAVALVLAYLFGGVVVVETVFQFPGIGLLLVTAIQNRDIPVIQVLVLLITLVYLVVSITADILTTLMTPRLRTQAR